MISYFTNSIEPNKDKKNRLQSKNDSKLYFDPFSTTNFHKMIQCINILFHQLRYSIIQMMILNPYLCILK